MSSTLQPSSQYVFGPANGGGDIIHFGPSQTKPLSWIDANGTLQGNLLNSSTGGPFPQFASYLFSVTGGVVSARNNFTGSVDFSGTDAAVVINSAIAATPSGGTFEFKTGVYNFNSCTLETLGSYVNYYYCVAIPTNAGSTNQYAVWRFVGEATSSVVGAALQTSGVIFNVTAAAITAAGVNFLNAFWHRPDVANNTGNDVTFENVSVTFPNNQRGNECAWNMEEADTVIWRNTVAAFAQAWGNPGASSYSFPVAGTAGLAGYTTPKASRGNTVRFDNTWAVGYDVGYDIIGEHIEMFCVNAQLCDYFIVFGGTHAPATINYTMPWVGVMDQYNRHGIFFGTNVASGLRQDIFGYHIETTTGTFARTDDMTESTAGGMSGIITYEHTTAGGIQTNLANIFSGGGGQNFTTFNAKVPCPLVPKLGTTTNSQVSSASPAVCGAAASGSFTVPTTTITYTVNTTAVTANSQIFLMPRTDNTSIPGAPTLVAPATGFVGVSARVAGTSFTITLPSTTGITCFDYFIIN